MWELFFLIPQDIAHYFIWNLMQDFFFLSNCSNEMTPSEMQCRWNMVALSFQNGNSKIDSNKVTFWEALSRVVPETFQVKIDSWSAYHILLLKSFKGYLFNGGRLHAVIFLKYIKGLWVCTGSIQNARYRSSLFAWQAWIRMTPEEILQNGNKKSSPNNTNHKNHHYKLLFLLIISIILTKEITYWRHTTKIWKLMMTDEN